MGWWTPDRIAYAVNYLIVNGGLSPYGAAGLVARWAFVEASAGPASINPISGAFGIAQWLTASRLNPIRGNTNFNDQLAYVVQELNGTERAAAILLRSANDPDSGATGASAYERAEGSKQLFPRDNYTGITANHTPGVLAIWQRAYGSADASQSAQTAEGETQTQNSTDTGAVNVPLMIGVGIGALVLLYLLTD